MGIALLKGDDAQTREGDGFIFGVVDLLGNMPEWDEIIKLCKKKRIGPSRIEDNRNLFYKKDISLLARNGFDFETSKRVMELNKDDYLKIIILF